MAVPVIGSALKKVFGTRNERMVKHYLTRVDQINQLEARYRDLSDPELRAMTDEFRDRVEHGEKPYDMIPEVFAVAREAMDRSVGIRNIFNPEESFDPGRLPEPARALYEEVLRTIEATDPEPPTGAFAGSREAVPSWQASDACKEEWECDRIWYRERD